MTDHEQAEQSVEAAEPKKVSLAEAVKQKLAQKKAEQSNLNSQQKGYQAGGNQMMKSQHTKKINNQRKRMGV